MTDLNGRGVGSDEMTFDLNGGRNLTLTAASVPSAGVIKGTFDLKMGQKLLAGWDVGLLTTTNTTIINGILVNNGNARAESFNVLKLTNTELVLCAGEPGAGDWGTAWFWMFKPKTK